MKERIRKGQVAAFAMPRRNRQQEKGGEDHCETVNQKSEWRPRKRRKGRVCEFPRATRMQREVASVKKATWK